MKIKPEFQKLMALVDQWSQWTYKGKHYVVMTVTPGMLSQDAEVDEWCPTVIYTTMMEHAKNAVHNTGIDYRFARPITEFVRKFEKVNF